MRRFLFGLFLFLIFVLFLGSAAATAAGAWPDQRKWTVMEAAPEIERHLCACARAAPRLLVGSAYQAALGSCSPACAALLPPSFCFVLPPARARPLTGAACSNLE